MSVHDAAAWYMFLCMAFDTFSDAAYCGVRYSLLDDTKCRDPVNCIAHSMSTRSISPVGIHIYRYILPTLLAVYTI